MYCNNQAVDYLHSNVMLFFGLIKIFNITVDARKEAKEIQLPTKRWPRTGRTMTVDRKMTETRQLTVKKMTAMTFGAISARTTRSVDFFDYRKKNSPNQKLPYVPFSLHLRSRSQFRKKENNLKSKGFFKGGKKIHHILLISFCTLKHSSIGIPCVFSWVTSDTLIYFLAYNTR